MTLEEKFIDNLIERTKENSVEWEYLDTNSYLASNLNIDFSRIIEDDSFYLELSNSYIVMAHFRKAGNSYEEYAVYIIPDSLRQIKNISSNREIFADKIIRLDNLIKSTCPNPEDIMDSFIKFGDDIPF